MEFGIKGSSMIVGVGVLSLSRKQLFIKISSLEAATRRKRLPAKRVHKRSVECAETLMQRETKVQPGEFKLYLLATNDR